MISEADEAAIDEHIRSLRVAEWPPLTTTERDIVRRALAPAQTTAAPTAAAA